MDGISRTVGAALCAFVMCGVASAGALAQEVCVTCQAPKASYNCVLKLPDGASAPPQARRLLQLACIEDIAKRHGHESCGVRRDMVGPCIGETHFLEWGQRESQGSVTKPDETASKPGLADRQQAPVGIAPSVTPQKQPEKVGASEPPKTVVEMAERAGKDSGRQLKEAGDAVGRGINKTWRCITSFFGDC
jgi:hypothetical protein